MKKLILFITVLLLAGGFLFAGGGQDGSQGAQAGGGGYTSPKGIQYPVPGNVRLTWLYPLPTQNYITSYSDNYAMREAERITGVSIEYIHPVVGQEANALNLMMASGDLPDMIARMEQYVPGIDRAIEERLVLRMNDIAERYSPDFMAVINSTAELRRQAFTDSGNLIGYGMIPVDTRGFDLTPSEESAHEGPMINKDWLDELGLPIPTTIGEWDRALRGFKSIGVRIPLLLHGERLGVSYGNGCFVSAYGIGPEFYVENGVIKYGAVQPGFKAYLEQMRAWYADEIIDRDYAVRTTTDLNALLYDNTTRSVGALMGQTTAFAVNAQAVGINMVGAPYPNLDSTTVSRFRRTNHPMVGWYGMITTRSRYPNQAAMFMNFMYTPEGFNLMNYGPQGVTYTTLNSDGFPDYIEPYRSQWDDRRAVFRLHNGNYLKSDMRSNPRRQMLDVEEWRALWHSDNSFVLPPITLTQEEGRLFAQIMADIITMRDEMVARVINGSLPPSAHDTFVENAYRQGLQRAIDAMTAAYERYQRR